MKATETTSIIMKKQSQRSISQIQITNVIKFTVSHNNPSKNVKTGVPVSKIMKQENLFLDTDALSFHPTNSSENEDISSDLSVVDTFI